eukprot:264622-Rhodomonas_salina.4
MKYLGFPISTQTTTLFPPKACNLSVGAYQSGTNCKSVLREMISGTGIPISRYAPPPFSPFIPQLRLSCSLVARGASETATTARGASKARSLL